MPTTEEIVEYCNKRTGLPDFPDFPGAFNGLQVENNGQITRIGAAVDAGLIPFQKAVTEKVDFLIVHHGMYWDQPKPLTGPNYQKVKTLLDGNCALYSCHLPLDSHAEIGNSALLAQKLELSSTRTFAPYEGRDIGLIVKNPFTRSQLKERLSSLFPKGTTTIEYGSDQPKEIGIVTGSGSSVIPLLRASGIDTLITGELKQNFFNDAQEENLNLYCCGHYATETFGISALAEELAKKFNIPWQFIPTECPL
jgi:dinuclear metal center YbgI/SA1388 family protein